MKQQLVVYLSLLVAVGQVYGNCGCLKCSKDLHILTPPSAPVQVMVKGVPPAGLLAPQILPPPPPPVLHPCAYPPPPGYVPPTLFTLPAPRRALDLQVGTVGNSQCQPVYAYKYTLQAPVPPPPVPSLPLTGLVAKPDRVVVQAKSCPVYIDNGAVPLPGGALPGNLACNSIFQQGLAPIQAPITLPVMMPPTAPAAPVLQKGPIIEPLALGDLFAPPACDCECRR